VSLSQLYVFLADRGMELDYMLDWWCDDHARWCWSVSRVGVALPVAWGTDLSEAGMVAHVLTIPQLHPDKPFTQALQDFGIDLGPFVE